MIKNEVHESEIKTYIPVSDTSETLKSAISLGNQVKQDIDVAIWLQLIPDSCASQK